MSSFEDNYRTWHTRLSLIKSAMRLASSAIAVACLITGDTTSAAWALAVGYGIAEIIGIAEESI